MSSDLAFMPALQQVQLIRAGQLSPLELVQLYLQRIEALDPQLGSFFTVAAEQALAEAEAKTERLTQTEDISELPPFFGVPTAIKDLNAVAGLPCSYGMSVLKDQLATYDEGIVSKMKQAGMIILGKTATPQVGTFPYTEPPGFPPTRNPWHLDYTAGGSSGGAAAAVAAGLCAIAQGSDGGGSIRIPAACCSLIGIKPSRGRVSHAPVGDYLNGISSNGPIAHNVADAAAMLDVLSGYITGDPYWLDDPDTSFLRATEEPVPRLRIAFATEIPSFGECDPHAHKAVVETAQLLEEMGHQLEEGCPDVSQLRQPFARVWQAGIAAAGVPEEVLDPVNRYLYQTMVSTGEYLQAVNQMQVIARGIVGFFENVDVLLLPVTMHSPIKIGEWAGLTPQEAIAKIINWVAPCPLANASGLPAITIPTGFDPQGLPVAVQLVGLPASETTLISLAAQLEAANPRTHLHPEFATDDD